jgi:hypothetical protein
MFFESDGLEIGKVHRIAASGKDAHLFDAVDGNRLSPP